MGIIKRRKTGTINLGGVPIGGKAPISVQSMTNAETQDVSATVRQIRALQKAGCDIVRIAVPNMACARCVDRIVRSVNIPVIADIHFNPALAIESILRGVHGIRINPGNMKSLGDVRDIIREAKKCKVAVRIGVNSGSIDFRSRKKKILSDREMIRMMVRRTMQYVRFFEKNNYRNIKLSLKASSVPVTMECYRTVAKLCDYPLHLGITAAGPVEESIIKSAVGIGGLLSEGIGDTIRVSSTGPPLDEVRIGIGILEALGLRKKRVEIISCPTCGRCRIDLTWLVKKIKRREKEIPDDTKVAVMGCVVNGPGEARQADIGIAGGKEFGVIFRRGREIRKVKEKDLVREFFKEMKNL